MRMSGLIGLQQQLSPPDPAVPAYLRSPVLSQPDKSPSPLQYVIHYFVERKGDQWQAFSLELGLAVQADTQSEVRQKLELMIVSYLCDALLGEDRAHAKELLSRKGTWRVFARYYLYSLTSHLTKFLGASKDRAVYTKSLPLEPKFC